MLARRAKDVAVYVLAIKGTPLAKGYCSELATIMQNFGEKASWRIFVQSKNPIIFKQAGPNPLHFVHEVKCQMSVKFLRSSCIKPQLSYIKKRCYTVIDK